MSRPAETLEQRRFTVEEYHCLSEAGVLAPGERVELIRGVIREMSPKRRKHVVAATKLLAVFFKALEGRASVYPEAPLEFADLDSEPEPDVVVCSNPDVEFWGTPHSKPLLVVELADSSLGFDMTEKAALYADARIPEYWVVNLVDRMLEVHQKPRTGSTRRACAFRAAGRFPRRRGPRWSSTCPRSSRPSAEILKAESPRRVTPFCSSGR